MDGSPRDMRYDLHIIVSLVSTDRQTKRNESRNHKCIDQAAIILQQLREKESKAASDSRLAITAHRVCELVRAKLRVHCVHQTCGLSLCLRLCPLLSLRSWRLRRWDHWIQYEASRTHQSRAVSSFHEPCTEKNGFFYCQKKVNDKRAELAD